VMYLLFLSFCLSYYNKNYIVINGIKLDVFILKSVCICSFLLVVLDIRFRKLNPSKISIISS
jgi:hypothetical protein